MRPDLGQVERVEPVARGLVERHHLNLHRPRRAVAPRDRGVQIAEMKVRVRNGHRGGFGQAEVLDPLIGLQVVLHPELLARGVVPAEGVAAVAVHVPPRVRGAPVAHQERDLVRGLGGQRPEVPLHVVVAQVGVRAALLAVDEVGELLRVADEEHRGVVADQVIVALLGIELDREPARIPGRVGAAQFARDRGEPDQQVRGGTLSEQAGLGELADVLGRLEHPVAAAALGVDDSLGHPFPVELGHLLDQVVILQQQRAVGTDRLRELITRRRRARIRGRQIPAFGHHYFPPATAVIDSEIVARSSSVVTHRSVSTRIARAEHQAIYPGLVRLTCAHAPWSTALPCLILMTSTGSFVT